MSLFKRQEYVMSLFESIESQLAILEQDIARFKKYSNNPAFFTYSKELLINQLLEIIIICIEKKQEQEAKKRKTKEIKRKINEYAALLEKCESINLEENEDITDQKSDIATEENILHNKLENIKLQFINYNEEKYFTYKVETLQNLVAASINFFKQHFSKEELYTDEIYGEYHSIYTAFRIPLEQKDDKQEEHKLPQSSISEDVQQVEQKDDKQEEHQLPQSSYRPVVPSFTRHVERMPAISQLQQSQDAKQHMKPSGSNMTQKQIINSLLHNNRILTLGGTALLAENRLLNDILKHSMTVAYNQTVQQQAAAVTPATQPPSNTGENPRPDKKQRSRA